MRVTDLSQSADAQRLLDALRNLVDHVGEAYVELSGQTAATQAVVADLRRCVTFLQTRLEGERPPPPWLLPPACASPPPQPSGRRLSRGPEPTQSNATGPRPGPPGEAAAATSEPATPVGPPALRQPSPARGGVGPASSAPATPMPRPGVHDSAAKGPPPQRPPLSGAGPRAPVGRSATPGRAVAAARNPASMPPAGRPSALAAARNRDPSPQRRGVASASAHTATPQAAGRGFRAHSPSTQATGTAAAPGPCTPGAAAPAGTTSGVPSSAFAPSTPQHQVVPDAAVSTPQPASHLPLVAQRAMAAAAAMADGGEPGGAATPGHSAAESGEAASGAAPPPAGPPQLPLAFRRALQRYREALSTREQLLEQHRHRMGGHATADGPDDVVAAAGRSFCSMLHHRLPGGGAGGVPPSSPGGAAAVLAGRLQQGLSLGEPPRLAAQREAVQALRRSAQVQFSAIVAAQTWLTQSLAELSKTRGSGGGVAAAAGRAALGEACCRLLAELRELRAQHQQTLQQLQQAEAALTAAEQAQGRPQSRPGTAVGGGVGRGGGRSDGAGLGSMVEAARAAVEALGIDQEAAEAAVMWRNRFLRAMLADVQQQQQHEDDGPGGRGAGGLGYGARGANVGIARRQQQQQQQAREQQQREQAQHQAATQGSRCLRMRMPLGVWLPHAMWAHAPPSAAAYPSPSASADDLQLAARALAFVANARPGQPGAPVTQGSQEPPWLWLLPQAHRIQQPGSALATHEVAEGALRMAASAGAAPPPLLCASAADALAHGRAMLQLQATVFQLVLEGVLAAPLLPLPQQAERAVGAQVAGLRQQQQLRGKGASARHVQGGGGSGSGGGGDPAVDRLLAQCRLAHLLLVKGAWTRLCSVVELDEQEDGERQGVHA